MSLNEEWERAGVLDFFTTCKEARGLLPAVCRSITKQNLGDKDDSGKFQIMSYLTQRKLISYPSRAYPDCVRMWTECLRCTEQETDHEKFTF